MKSFIEFLERKYNEGALEENLYFIQQEIISIFNKIKTTSSVEDAHPLFDVLEKVQSILEKSASEDELLITPNIKKFIHDFKQVNNKEIRNYLYSIIKNHEDY